MAALLALAGATAVHAKTVNVSGGGDALQAAINKAATGDVLLVGPGTYLPIDTGNKFLTIRSTHSAAGTTIDANHAARCAKLGPSWPETILEGFTLTNGYTDDSGGGALYGTLNNCNLISNSATVFGGGAWCCTLNNCVLLSNSAWGGGGASTCTLDNCYLGNNSAGWGGGACGCDLYNCYLGNNSTTGSNGKGGGAYDCDLYDCTLSSNTAAYGGGAYECDLLYDCTLSSNKATGSDSSAGGGAYNCWLSRCTLTGNTATGIYSAGGGAYNNDGYPMYNCLLTGNSATFGGGACGCDLYNCTVSANSVPASGTGGGVCDCRSVNNSIVWGNTGGGTSSNYAGICTFDYSCTAPIPGGDGNISANPRFVNTAQGNYALQSSSPCINQGDNYYVDEDYTQRDLAGNARIAYDDVDMGAYEYNSAPIVPWLTLPADTPATAATSYSGFIYDSANTLSGTVTLSTKLDKKGNWTLSAKVITQAATLSFSGKQPAPVTPLSTVTFKPAKKGEALTLTPCTSTVTGTFKDAAGKPFTVVGTKNVFAAKAAPLPANFVGIYNVLFGEMRAQAYRGYMSLSTSTAGTVKYAGKLDDGTAVSGSTKLLGPEGAGGRWLCIPLHKPLYSKKGAVGGLLWLDLTHKSISTDEDSNWSVDWDSPVHGKRKMLVMGGWFGNGKDVQGLPAGTYKFQAFPSFSYFDYLPPVPGLTPTSGWMWMGDTMMREPMVTITPITSANIYSTKGALTNAKLLVPKLTPPVLNKATGLYSYSGDNPNGLTLTYMPKTGLIKGSYKIYYDGTDAAGKPKHLTYTVSYGAVSPVPGMAAGVGTATINKQKVPFMLGMGPSY